jgi:hypothetical protein
MTAIEYNQAQYDQELLQMPHITRMVRLWQTDNDLLVDGYCGPNTIESLESIPVVPADSMLEVAWTHAIQDIGKGGDGVENNEGVYLDEIRARTRMPRLGGGAWCAVGISNWCVLADLQLGMTVKSRSAPMLAKNILSAGGTEVEHEDMTEGQVGVGLYARGNINSGLHHVRMVRKGQHELWTGIGANERGDKVRLHTQTTQEMERRLIKIVLI